MNKPLDFSDIKNTSVLIHNHPSGEVIPSKQDVELTNKLFEIGSLMGVPILDHIIIGKDKYYSFYENMNNIKNNE